MEVISDVKLDDANLWIPGLDGQEYSHEQWITKLACTLIESGLVKDEVLFVLSPICKTKVFQFSYWKFTALRIFPSLCRKRQSRSLPSSKNPHFQNEARCTTFLVKMSFICMRMKNDFHIKG